MVSSMDALGSRLFILYLICFASDCLAQDLQTPKIPKELKNTPEVRSFYHLWEYSLEVDVPSNSEILRSAAETPKTLVVPSEFSMANLVPQDSVHILYLNDPPNKQLRMEFLSHHFVKEKVREDDPKLYSEGKLVSTLSGETLLIHRDPDGSLFVDDVEVRGTLSLKDGTQIFILEKPLFNLDKKVREAFAIFHRIEQNPPLGPPLDIPGPPAAPPPGAVRTHSVSADEIKPPALPEGILSPSGLVELISAPAPPPTPVSSQHGRPARTNQPLSPPAQVDAPVGPPGTPLKFDLLVEDDIIKPPAPPNKETHSRVEMSAIVE